MTNDPEKKNEKTEEKSVEEQKPSQPERGELTEEQLEEIAGGKKDKIP